MVFPSQVAYPEYRNVGSQKYSIELLELRPYPIRVSMAYSYKHL